MPAVNDLELGSPSYPVDGSGPASTFICAVTLREERDHLNCLHHLDRHLLQQPVLF